MMPSQPDLAVVIITLNEEKNIAQALESLCRWPREVFVLDSFSTDRTLEIARQYGVQCVQNRFQGFAEQRNFALDNLPIGSEWVMFLDADEWVTPELAEEVSRLLATKPSQNGFFVKRRLIWMGRWIRRGYYPTWILRIMRRGSGRFEKRSVNEHIKIEGEAGFLFYDLMHEDRKGLVDWIDKHNRYALLEARELLTKEDGHARLALRLFGSQAERKRWVREKIWNHLPPMVRPLLYFFYRYVLRGGFLDGREGFTYHFLQALWYRLLIDINYMELKRTRVANFSTINMSSGAQRSAGDQK